MRLDSFLPRWGHAGAVSRPEALVHLRRLQTAHPDSLLPHFTSWPEALSWLDRAGWRNEAADAVLRPVLLATKRDLDANWHEILLFLFSPPLLSLYRGLRRLDSDPRELAAEVGWALLQAVHRLDLDRRSARLGQKILNDAQHDVRQRYARETALRARVVGLDQSDDEGQDTGEPIAAAGAEDPAYARLDRERDAERALAHLRGLVQRGRLDRSDYLILVGSYVHGRSVEAMAARLGLSLAAAKKRRQRARWAFAEIRKKMSPGGPRPPLKNSAGQWAPKEEP